jgi:hypothetical protein
MEATGQDERTLRRQLVAFAQFTTRSLTEADIPSLMLDACLRARVGMDVTHAKLLEYLPESDRLILRAGVGWKEGYVGHYQVPPIPTRQSVTLLLWGSLLRSPTTPA